ncbi:MAG: FAD-binding oxidoreductase [Lentisphaeria bacterium]|jgi:alkyldihydroxyacetonephosphate synthase
MLTPRDSYSYEMLRSELTWTVGDDNVQTDCSEKLAHSIDYYWVPEVWHDRGLKPQVPTFIVHPGTTEEVAEILKIANTHKIPVTPWGGGSGSQGGALPMYGGICLDTKRLNKVLEIDPVSLTVTAEAGIIMQHLEWEVQKAGFSTMHFPASGNCATLGGFIAHRGTGVLSTRYGKIEDMIMSMEVVTPTGEIINTLPVPRHASGPDLAQVFLGSEGTLGVVTKATMKIHPIPEVRKFHAYLFSDLHSGMVAGEKLMARRLAPSVIRLYDHASTISIIKRVLGIERKGAYLVFGYDGEEDIVDLQMKKAVAICEETAVEDLGTEGGQTWWDQRYKFYYPPYTFQMPQAFGTLDTVATFANIEKVYWGMKEAVNKHCPEANYIGHFSHWYDWGCMLYARFIIEKPPQDAATAVALYNRIWDAAIRAAIKNGGVINEHHGVGLKLGRIMRDLYGPAFNVLEGIKKTLDPNNIMNPGKMGFQGV